MGTLISKPYVKGRSPWEMLLIPDYQFVDDDGRTCSGSVVTLKIHHGLADGFSIWKLLIQLFDVPSPIPSAKFPKLSWSQKFLMVAVQVLKFPHDVAEMMALSRDEPSSWHITDRKLTRRYVSFSSDRVPASTIKAIKNKCGAGYNTAVYAIVAGAIVRLMREAGQEVSKSMTSFIPFPLPNHPGGLVNHWAELMFRFSPSKAKALDRLKEIATQLPDTRSVSTLPTSYSWYMKIMVTRPNTLLYLFIPPHFSITMKSFPGPEKPMKILEGVKVMDVISAGSNGPRTTGAVAACTTMAGYQRIFLTVDQLIFTGYSIPTNFNKLVNQEVNEMLKALKEN